MAEEKLSNSSIISNTRAQQLIIEEITDKFSQKNAGKINLNI